MRIIPDRFPACPKTAGPKERAGLNAERQVFDLLSMTAGDGFVTFRTPLCRHEFKRRAEADFIVVRPEGVFVLEVKSSPRLHRSEVDGCWYDGSRRMDESPWQQAEGAMYAVERHLVEAGITPKPLVGFGVVLAGAELPAELMAIDVDRATLMDRSMLQDGESGMAAFLDGLVAYWTRGDRARRGRPRPRLEEDRLQEIESHLAPAIDLRPRLRSTSREIRRTLDQLTAEQYRLVNFVQDDRRVVEGGAGTGKTFVAVELAKDAARRGERVGLVVRSSVLARHLASLIADQDGIVACSLQRLADMQEDGEGPTFDFLIVDEGQDLLEESSILVLDRSLDGGLEHGRWRWFMDPNNQSHVSGRLDPEVLQLVRELAVGQPSLLQENCRNTAPMVDRVASILQADLGKPRPNVLGPEPRVTTSAKVSPETQARRLSQDLAILQDDGAEPGDISVVVVGSEAYIERLLDALPATDRGFVRRFSTSDLAEWPPSGMTVAMLAGEIKGLENDHIIVLEGEGVDGKTRNSSIYVALTRGRVTLRAHLAAGAGSAEGIA